MSTPIHITYLLSFILLIGLVGCSEDSNAPSIFFNLEDEFVIRPIEILSQSENKLSLEISALQPDACDDAEILYQYRLLDGISVIKLNDLVSPTSCQTNEDPPSTTIALTKSNPLEYKLNITIKEIIENIGQIIESEDHYDFFMQTLNGIRVDHTRLNKIPGQAIWGVVDFSSQDSSFVADAFMSELLQYRTDHIFDSGYYGHFELDDSGNLKLFSHPLQHIYRNGIVMESSATLAQISPIVEHYRNRYPTFSFTLFNGFGDSL